MMKKLDWGLVGAIGGVCLAPFTGGATLTWTIAGASAGLGFAGGKILEGAGILGNNNNSNNDNNNANQNLEAFKLQTEQWKELVKAREEESKRLREEKDEENKKLKHNNEEIERLRSVINNPHASEEEKNNAKKRIVILEDENKDLKKKLDKISEKLDDLSKVPPAPSRPWNLPNLSNLKLIDKALIAGGVVLLIYLLIPESKKK
jgi:hypothetical protein